MKKDGLKNFRTSALVNTEAGKRFFVKVFGALFHVAAFAVVIATASVATIGSGGTVFYIALAVGILILFHFIFAINIEYRDYKLTLERSIEVKKEIAEKNRVEALKEVSKQERKTQNLEAYKQRTNKK